MLACVCMINHNSMTVHQMKLQAPAFEKIKNGKKTLEARIYDDKRKKMNIGDTIDFYKIPEMDEKIRVKITGLLIYRYFADLFEDVPAKYMGYKESDKDYLKVSMYEVYDKKEEEKYGVIGIKFQIL